MQWTGEERRKDPDSSVTAALERISIDFQDFRAESRKYRIETQRDILCLKDGFSAFRDKYQKHLDERLAVESYWIGVRKDLLASVVKSLVTATLVAIGVIVALGGQTWFRSWLVLP
jgi:hypothetical protein